MLHDVPHVFHVGGGGGTGTAIMELKIVKDLSTVNQDPLLLVLFDLIKVYDNLDRDHILNTLEGFRV